MKIQLRILSTIAVALAAFGPGLRLFAEENTNAASPATTAAAIAAYPMKTCVVSGESLTDGDMGPPFNHVYKEEGKPDRLVRLCCKSCVRKFNKEPAKYLKQLDDARAGKTHGEKPEKGEKEDAHAGHHE